LRFCDLANVHFQSELIAPTFSGFNPPDSSEIEPFVRSYHVHPSALAGGVGQAKVVERIRATASSAASKPNTNHSGWTALNYFC